MVDVRRQRAAATSGGDERPGGLADGGQAMSGQRAAGDAASGQWEGRRGQSLGTSLGSARQEALGRRASVGGRTRKRAAWVYVHTNLKITLVMDTGRKFIRHPPEIRRHPPAHAPPEQVVRLYI